MIGTAREAHSSLAVSAVLAFGSNVGDRVATIRGAIDDVGRIDGVAIDAVSDLVESPALTLRGVSHDEPTYLNAVATIYTSLPSHELLRAVHAIEGARGRVRKTRWGNRTLDIDIVTFAEVESSDDELTLPHSRAWSRGFVLVPWLQIDPDAFLPGHGRVADLAT